ncbi:MAG: glutamate 5-kinase [Cyclobacteriaceae bacterium]|nr:glutamate 5-kinase [Cyclobacteriaceae bacterium]MDH4296442.1 glutamate 5-kinase [Cyclobacteriaceae bacterium]MDH5249387.1 glutamate 5-kinase [Cyclobacteriaceae bacterium]
MSASKKLAITIKIGSNVITNSQGFPDEQVIVSISSQIKTLRDSGHQVLVITSGAVAAGRSIYQFQKKTDTVVQRQVLSSIGQVKLISMYKEIFERQGIICSQVLVTKEDFKSRNHYLNMKNCLTGLLNNQIVPVINENDVISVTELMFTDNDELAGLVSAMMNTDMLIILTNVDGVYDGDPAEPGTRLMHTWDPALINLTEIASVKKSGFGRGGILTKVQTSAKIAGMGIPVHIGNGRTENIVIRILSGEEIGTRFPAKKLASNFKKYMAHAYEEPKGKVVINKGAKEILLSDKAKSLLPIGIIRIVGKFKKGDIVRIIDEKDHEIGLGLARYGFKKAKEVIGLKNQKPIIHYDHLYLH